jgi:hypothetical protein
MRSLVAPSGPPAATAPRKRASALRVLNGAIHVDGRLDEREWSTSPAAADETQSRSGALPSRSLVVKLTHLLSF